MPSNDIYKADYVLPLAKNLEKNHMTLTLTSILWLVCKRIFFNLLHKTITLQYLVTLIKDFLIDGRRSMIGGVRLGD